MAKFRMTLTIMTASATLFALMWFAQPAQSQMMGHPGMRDMPGQRGGMGPMTGMGPYGSGRGAFDIEMLRRALDLNDEQMQKLRNLRTSYRKEMIQRKAKIKVGMLDLWEIIDAKKLDLGKAEKKVKELEAMQSDLMIYRIKSLEETRKFLTDEQYELFRELGFRSMRHGMGSMGSMGGMHGSMMGRGMMGHGMMDESYEEDYE